MRKALLNFGMFALALVATLAVTSVYSSAALATVDDPPAGVNLSGECRGEGWSFLACVIARADAMEEFGACIDKRRAECKKDGGDLWLPDPMQEYEDNGTFRCDVMVKQQWYCVPKVNQ